MALPEPELAAQQPAAEFSLFVDGGPQTRRARGRRRPRERADDYAAHFHHYPWRGAGLTLRPRLLRRLGVEVTSTHDDESDEDAELELAAAGEHWVAAVKRTACCTVLLDARGAIIEALKTDVSEACRLVARLRRICADAGLNKLATDAHWEADELRCSFGRCGVALAFCAKVIATAGPGCRAALHWGNDAVATEAPSGRPFGAAFRILSALLEGVHGGDVPRCRVTDACHQKLAEEGLDDAGAWTQIKGGYLRAPWPSTIPLAASEVAPLVPVDRTVVVAMLAFDASVSHLAGSCRVYVQRRRALEVVDAAFTSGGGRRATGSETVYVFESCAQALGAVLAARSALERFGRDTALQVKATGFGIARGPVFDGAVVAGAPVGAAARLCYDLCGRAAPGGVLLSARAAGALRAEGTDLRLVPVFLQGDSGTLDEVFNYVVNLEVVGLDRDDGVPRDDEGEDARDDRAGLDRVRALEGRDARLHLRAALVDVRLEQR